MTEIPGALRALASHLIDYAGVYPPAALPLAEAVEQYREILAGPENWILNRMVLPARKLADVRLGGEWRVTLVVDGEPGQLPRQVETLETKGRRKLSLPTYCEAPIAEIEDGFAKVRTGGLTPEATPSAETLADFLAAAAARRLPFKATAGLHHALRAGAQHGFLNVFVAAVFAWHNAGRGVLVDILDETDSRAFAFGNAGLLWRGRGFATAQVEAARRLFAHSFGSCSFDEPVGDLRDLGLLP
jgi:hypothetical protein